MKKTPITLITGFLGSGKTTLVNHLLSSSTEKIAIIVNEFGEVGIDDQLILRTDKDIMELTTGSICCAAKNDTLQVFETLLERKGGDFSRVILETTGLANPAPLIRAFQQKKVLVESFFIESVVTVIDSMHALEQFGDRPEMSQQIVFADIVLINKIESTPPEVLLLIETQVRRINPLARQFRVSYSKIDADLLFDPSLFEEERPLVTSDAKDDHHEHDGEVESMVLRVAEPLDLNKVAGWIGRELLLDGDKLLRYKGILLIDGMLERFVFQGVHHEFENRKDRLWKEGENKQSEVVLIGKNLDRTRLKESFEACRA